MSEQRLPVPCTFLVDGSNVMGSRGDGWWHDRPAARRRLVEDLRPLAPNGVCVVFDGLPHPIEAPDGIDVRWSDVAGMSSADDLIVTLARTTGGSATTIVTADRGLIGRLPAGQPVMGPTRFLDLLEG